MDFNHQIRGGSARLVDGSADLPDVAAEDIAFEKSNEECMVVIVRHKDQEDEATIEKRKKLIKSVEKDVGKSRMGESHIEIENEKDNAQSYEGDGQSMVGQTCHALGCDGFQTHFEIGQHIEENKELEIISCK